MTNEKLPDEILESLGRSPKAESFDESKFSALREEAARLKDVAKTQGLRLGALGALEQLAKSAEGAPWDCYGLSPDESDELCEIVLSYIQRLEGRIRTMEAIYSWRCEWRKPKNFPLQPSFETWTHASKTEDPK